MGLEAGISATAAHHLTASGPLASRVRGLKEGNERIILAARRETGVLVRPQQSLPPDLSAIPLISPTAPSHPAPPPPPGYQEAKE